MAKKKVTKRKKGKVQKPRYKKYLVLLAFLFITGFVAFVIYTELAVANKTAAEDKYYVKGIDLSHHNPIINWSDAAEQGISFAYLKASESVDLKDRNYEYNYKLAKKIGVRVGAYHFYTFGDSGKDQATHFIQTSKSKHGDLIPAIDVEHSRSNPHSKDTAYVATVIKELKILENTLYEYYGVHPLIYTNKHCYELYVRKNFKENFIWMCDLDAEPKSDINWRIWQYSHKGRLRSLDENIDMNYYRYSFEEFKELLLP